MTKLLAAASLLTLMASPVLAQQTPAAEPSATPPGKAVGKHKDHAAPDAKPAPDPTPSPSPTPAPSPSPSPTPTAPQGPVE
ncbi:MAG: hypothetical protein QM676_08285 [Novosphingobium sp.]